MANVPLHFSATIEDGFAVRKSTDVYLNVPDTTTLAQLVTAEGTWLTDLDALTAGAIIANQIRIVPSLPGGLKSATGSTWAASRVNQSGLLRFSASGTTENWSNVIPALANSVIVNGKIDKTSGAYTNYVNLLTTGGNNYTNPNRQPITGIVAEMISFRKTRKQSINKSFEA